jgi:D-alanyl-D-alanine carboxypeptidase
MKVFFLFQILVLLMVLQSCSEKETCSSPETTNINEELQTLIDEEYGNYIANYPGFPGGIAIHVSYPNGEAFVQSGFSEPITKNHYLRAQSITKTFTASGIMLLHQRGLLNIRSSIIDIIPNSTQPYIPDTPNYNIPHKDSITIWQLLTHRAGVFDPVNDDTSFLDSVLASDPNYTFSFDDVIGYVARLQQSYFLPGTDYKYSNAGYVLLAKIIERVSGKSYQQFMNDEFIIPLELTATSFPDQGSEQTLPTPFINTMAWVYGQTLDLTEQNMTYDVGEGNMISSTNDLNKFFKLLINGDAGISSLNVNNYMLDCRPMHDIGAVSQGAGLEYFNNLGYGHGGDGTGFTIRSFYDPSTNIMITGLFNCWNYKDGADNASYFMEQQNILYYLLYETKSKILD